MSTAVAEDLEVLEDTLDRKGWVSRPEYRERGFELMLAWDLGRRHL